MGALNETLNSASRTVSYMLGAVATALAAAVLFTSGGVEDIAAWARDVLGWGFVVMLSTLIFASLFCWVRMMRSAGSSSSAMWYEAGLQAANGVTTLALTFTLLGISLGIGTLAGQELTPETIQPVIRKMTANFSLAFMTTVVGLPLSAVLRSLLVITRARARPEIEILPPPGARSTGERDPT